MYYQCEVKKLNINHHFTSKNDAPVALICPLINLEVSPSTVETSTYLSMLIYGHIASSDQTYQGQV